MTYTIWHNGRCLGQSPLDFIYREHKTHTGFLHPTPAGEKLLPMAGGTCAAANALHRAARKCPAEERERLPEYAAFEAASRKAASFQFELRGPTGAVIPTEYVGVTDFGFIDDLGDDAFDDDLEEADEVFGEELLASFAQDDWNAKWSAEEDQADRAWDFDEEALYEPWRAREERDCERRMSRFQVQVTLIDDSSVP